MSTRTVVDGEYTVGHDGYQLSRWIKDGVHHWKFIAADGETTTGTGPIPDGLVPPTPPFTKGYGPGGSAKSPYRVD